MRQTHPSGTGPRFVPSPAHSPVKSLSEQIAEAVESRATPLSQLLRLMSALDDQDAAHDPALRLRLRARIGAPLDA